jgi:Cohesin loading factor
MHHLLARVTFRKNPKAALKALDTAIQEVEMYGNSAWAYALRFLRVSLSLQTNTHHEILLAIQNLKSIIALAEKSDDKAIYVTALALEALAHIHSESAESMINAQEAIASARSLQMHPSTTSIPQVWWMLSCIDLTCTLVQFKAQEAAEKTKMVQTSMDELVFDKKSWTANGACPIPLGKKSAKKVTDFCAQIYTQAEDGLVYLQTSWLKDVDAYAIAYLLSGCTAVLKAPLDPKAETYIQEGIKVLEGKCFTLVFRSSLIISRTS